MTPYPVHDTRTYAVQGMNCSHCVTSVRAEVSEVAGVQDVEVELGSSRMTVTGGAIGDAAVEAAVAEAGYEVVS